MPCFPGARLFCLHDSDPVLREKRGSFPVSRGEARLLNGQGYGVFHVVNEYRDRRLLSNLTQLNWWYCECDEGTKQEQLRRIRRAPLLPSVVVESRNGYHCYWRIRGAPTLEIWKRIVRWGVVPVLRGDRKATDGLRLLRAPGYHHRKNPAQPWPVRIVWQQDWAYTERQMLRSFKPREPQPRLPRPVLASGEGTFWQRVAALDGREAIRRASGTELVNGETFTLAEQWNGNANIIRGDGVSTGCWVWKDGRLGGVQEGGTIAAWCHWYGHSWKTIAEGLRGLFPELGDEDE